jgi:putative transport protein
LGYFGVLFEAAWSATQAHGALLVGTGLVVICHYRRDPVCTSHLRMNPVISCGTFAGAMTVDAAVTGARDVAECQTPVLGVAVPYAVINVLLTVLGPIIVTCTFVA